MHDDRRARVRLRQAVLVATELEPLVARLREELGLHEPFRDPGVELFGLENAVFAVGDCFLEVVSPRRPDTAAGRYLERHGDGGYMVMFDLEDLDGARARVAQAGVRVVWSIDLPDISGTHLHPGDTRGAIVSLDRSDPYGSWRWGGPQWTARTGAGADGQLLGVTIAVAEPDGVARRWGAMLGVAADAVGAGAVLRLDGGEVRFEAAAQERVEGLASIALALPERVRAGRAEVALGGLRVLLPAAGAPG